MSFSAKPDDPRSSRKPSLPETSLARRHGQPYRTARRQGPADRRLTKPEAASAAPTGARIIYLSWADTFGRPARPWLPGMTAQVLPFRLRQPATDCA